MNSTLLAVFATTHLTLKAEKALKEAGVGHRTIMKPRKISSDCGLAIRFDMPDMERARSVFSESSCLPARIFRQSEKDWECLLKVEK